jgi:hypothetical protein
MPGLTLGQGIFGLLERDDFFLRQKIPQEGWFVMAAAAPVIAQYRFGNRLWVEPEFLGEKFKEQFHQPHQRDAVGAVRARVQPVAEMEK